MTMPSSLPKIEIAMSSSYDLQLRALTHGISYEDYVNDSSRLALDLLDRVNEYDSAKLVVPVNDQHSGGCYEFPITVQPDALVIVHYGDLHPLPHRTGILERIHGASSRRGVPPQAIVKSGIIWYEAVRRARALDLPVSLFIPRDGQPDRHLRWSDLKLI